MQTCTDRASAERLGTVFARVLEKWYYVLRSPNGKMFIVTSEQMFKTSSFPYEYAGWEVVSRFNPLGEESNAY